MLKMKINLIHYFNIFFIAFCIIWQPFQLYVLHVDAAGRTIMLLSVVAFLLNFNRILFLFRHTKSVRIWCVLVLYALVNSLLQGYVSEYGAFGFFPVNFTNPLVFLLIVTLEIQDNCDSCVAVMLVAYLVFLFFGAFHLSGSPFDRVMSEMGNMLPLTAVACVFMVAVLFVWKRVRLLSLLLVVAFCLFVVIIAATRKAMGAIVILLFGVLLARNREGLWVLFIKMLCAFAFFYIAINYVLDNTLIGERIVSNEEYIPVQMVKNEKLNDFLMIALGDRAIQYVGGFEVFREHPVFGIGIGNYMTYTETDYRLHTEYMVQLCENGLVGFILLLLFYISVFRGRKRIRAYDRNFSILLCFGLLAVLFIDFTSWTYDMNYIMSIYGVMIGCSNINYYENSNLSSEGLVQRPLD